MKNLNICIAGLGNVGSSVIKSIQENHSYLKDKSSIEFNILGISAKNKNKKRSINIEQFEWFDNPLELINIKKCDVLIELIGFEKGLSFDLIHAALSKKIHVVTGNKALIAKHGTELFNLADKNNCLLLYEAAVAGGIPIIKMIKNSLFLNKIKKISGILNGTTNYILTKMKEDNLNFDQALSIAKEKGYTSDSESDLDIDGIDSAHKLTILSSLCFGSKLNFNNNEITGISKLKIDDIFYAEKLGYNIKLISEAYVMDNKIYSVTSPKLLDKNSPMANVNGVLNAINIETNHHENIFVEGEGAGGTATASSIISDLYEIVSNSKISSLGYKSKALIDLEKFHTNSISSSYYLRIMTKDIPGVLSNITSLFKDLEISIKKILQLPENNQSNSPIPIIITTHNVKKNQLIEAINKIELFDFVLEKISIISIDNDD